MLQLVVGSRYLIDILHQGTGRAVCRFPVGTLQYARHIQRLPGFAAVHLLGQLAQAEFAFAHTGHVRVLQTFQGPDAGMDAAPNDGGGQFPAQKSCNVYGIVEVAGHQGNADQIGRLA